MQKQQMVYLPLKDIKPYENNPRKNDDAVDKVAASLSAFGPQSRHHCRSHALQGREKARLG